MRRSEEVKILVVDDTEATRYAIARTLRAHHFSVIEASSGEEALKQVFSEKPDLVTLDIHLPDILGFEVCRRIKQDERSALIPVLQVSASYVTSKDRINGLEGGADGYLTHPFEPPVLIATVRALLRTRKLHEDLSLSEERFRVALKNAPITIYSSGLDLRYDWIYNPPSPLSVEDFVGKTDAEIYSPADTETLTDLKCRAMKSGAGERAVIQLTLAGQARFYDCTVEPYFENGGLLSGLTVACIDITERVEAERIQLSATEEATLANQAKSRFLSNMSHEIRTPLGIIQGFADLALDRDTTQADRDRFLQTIKRNAQNLTKLLGEILDLSKIEAGRIEIESTKFSLSLLVSEVISALALQAEAKGISLRYQTQGPFPTFIISDPTRLRQILMNLISNAIKFSGQGEVAVTAALHLSTETGATDDHVSGQNSSQEAVIKFRVADTGIGVSEEQQARLFQPFTQADSSTTRKFGGTGLGLSLSQKLAQSLGGQLVLLQSEINAGSVFEFTFKAGYLTTEHFQENAVSNSKDDTVEVAVPKRVLEGVKILLVEDSPDNQLLFTRYLTGVGALVEIASDGLIAVAMVEKKDYDILVMDLQMPNLDGYGAIKQIRRSEHKMPVIALTAHAMKEERENALKLGFSAYLIKPIASQLLIKTIHHFTF